MAYDPGAIDATLAAAVGNDPALIAELRLAFHDSAERTLAARAAAGDDAVAWVAAAARLRGLAASFGAVRLMAQAAAAAEATPGDEQVTARLRRAVARL
jgi:HPt (histidine-containing phosphotransfer) domain-containing protein